MSRKRADLAQLLAALDPEAAAAQRHLQLIALLDWVRGDSQVVQAATDRVAQLVQAAEQSADTRTRLQAWWAALTGQLDITTLLADFGFAQRTAMTSELMERLRYKLLPASPEAATKAGMTERDVFEATDYYKTPRGQQPGGWTRMLFSHAQNTLGWTAFGFIETLMTQPMMVVIGQKVGAFGAYCDGMEAYGRATASKDRQLVSLTDWSHYDLYDKDEPVSLAMERMVPFLKQHVAGEAPQAQAAE